MPQRRACRLLDHGCLPGTLQRSIAGLAYRQDMSLAFADFLHAVKSSWASHFGSLGTLTVNDPGRKLSRSPRATRLPFRSGRTWEHPKRTIYGIARIPWFNVENLGEEVAKRTQSSGYTA